MGTKLSALPAFTDVTLSDLMHLLDASETVDANKNKQVTLGTLLHALRLVSAIGTVDETADALLAVDADGAVIGTIVINTLQIGAGQIASGTFADARIAASNVTQHQAALSLTKSQISDFGTYLTDITGEALSTLADVTISSIASGEVLVWNGSAWINNTLVEAGIAAASHNHAASDITSGTLAHERGGIEADISAVAKGDILAGTATGTIGIVAASGASDGDVLTVQADGSVAYEAPSGGGGGLSNVVEDTTPQLGGPLDVNLNAIVSEGGNDIAITPDTSGSIVLDGLSWPQSDGSSGQVLETDGAGQLSWGSGGGGGDTLPIVDSTAVVKDPADATKLVRIDAGAIATSTTRVITMGDRDVDLASGGTFAEASHNHAASGITSGTLAHERGGIEADISAVAKGDILAGTGTGAIGIIAASGASDGDVLTIQADGSVAWEAAPGTGSGEANTASNVGASGVGVFDSKVSFDLQFNKIAGGTGLTVGLASNVITVSQTALTASRALVTDGSGDYAASDVTATELSYLDGVTSAIQTQLNAKAASSHNHAASEITSGTFDDARIAQSNVTQHQTALSITESQISNLGTYLSNVVGDTTPQLGGMLDVNGNSLGDGTAILLGFFAASTGGEYLRVANANSGFEPTLSAQGTGVNIGIRLTPKGTGAVKIQDASGSCTLQLNTSSGYAEIQNGTNSQIVISGELQLGGQVWGPLATITDGATVTVNWSTGNMGIVTLGGNRTIAFSNLKTGQRYTLWIKQDGTGSRTLSWPSYMIWDGGTAPTLATTGGNYDCVVFTCIDETTSSEVVHGALAASDAS